MKYDLAIVGAGPAGLSASVYASRYGIKNVVIGGIAGGLVTETHEIGNWLGTQKITGFDFAQKAVAHAQSLGANIELVNVDRIEKDGDEFELFLSSGKKIQAKTILLTMGTKHRHLGVPGEKELAGKGVSYCATCDGFFYRGKIVAVVGGSDSAASAALHLAGIVEKVFLIYRGEKLRAENFWVESILKNEKITVLYNTNIKEIKGEQKVEDVVLDSPFEGSDVLKIDGIFVEIGLAPNVNLVENLNIDLDEDGHIKIESDGRTSEKGIWAAGDITTGSNKFKQIVTAAAEGAIATASIQKHLKK
ncbi:MAG: FAD-dependent oxidoreductase [Candidatus Moranbacteria bacterium]|jgi:thioredoxin reductase (NADPH)|nr:FAD-dependent oxidoreductase [Candidatus Moranbacteria bacterium]